MIFAVILAAVLPAIRAFMQAKVGDLCLPIGMPKYELDGGYLECIEKSPGAGEWVRRECPIGTRFDALAQQCNKHHNFWRDSVDFASPYEKVQRQAPFCPTASTISPGAPCSWYSTPVATCDNCPQSNYLACTQNSFATTGSPCGTWQQYTCPQGTGFNQQLLICVTQQGVCPTSNQIPIAPCTVQPQCPGASQCLQNTCCVTPTQTLPTVNQCSCCCFGTGQASCPIGNQCINNVCCPTTITSTVCPNGQPPLNTCTNNLQCPSGFSCINGGCCSIVGVATNVLCPTGLAASATCVGTGQSSCAAGQTCIDPNDNIVGSGCCPLAFNVICPAGQPVFSTCIATSGIPCPVGQTCINGGCCGGGTGTTCPDGQAPLQTCTITAQCPSGYTCLNGGCCAIAGGGTTNVRCPSGLLASAPCVGIGQGNCPAGQTCTDANDNIAGSGCCPTAAGVCPNGTPVGSTCIITSGVNCPVTQTCTNGACCPAVVAQQVLCPDGTAARQICTGIGVGSCPAGQICTNANDNNPGSGCCTQATGACPNGQPPGSTCTLTSGIACPIGQTCTNGACCPNVAAQQVRCPDGTIAPITCVGLGQSTCAGGQTCTNANDLVPDSGCCMQAFGFTCPNGQQPGAVCTLNSGIPCPIGQSCQSGGCC